MTLEQVFPGLREAPSGTILALADNVFDFSGPARALTSELALNEISTLIKQVQAIDPNYRFGSLGFPRTLEGQVRQIHALRFERAAPMLRNNGELSPLQVETLRLLQVLTDQAYDRGLDLLNKGKMPIHISERLSLGNYIDREVRRDIRYNLSRYGISSSGSGPVRINRRENDSSASETTFRRPDARIGRIAYDVTLEAQTLKTDQVRGFFATEFQPTQVIIIRPSQLGSASTYIIKRPEARR